MSESQENVQMNIEDQMPSNQPDSQNSENPISLTDVEVKDESNSSLEMLVLGGDRVTVFGLDLCHQKLH